MVQHKGWFTEEFPILRGVRQGSLLSCHLFNLVSQTTVIFFQQKGLIAEVLNTDKDPNSIYVDDVALVVK